MIVIRSRVEGWFCLFACGFVGGIVEVLNGH